MTTERLQLTLIADLRPKAQPLSAEARVQGIELIAMMLVHLVRKRQGRDDTAEVRDESR